MTNQVLPRLSDQALARIATYLQVVQEKRAGLRSHIDKDAANVFVFDDVEICNWLDSMNKLGMIQGHFYYRDNYNVIGHKR